MKSAAGADFGKFPHFCNIQTSAFWGLENAENRICRAAQRSPANPPVGLHQNAGSRVWKRRKLKKTELIKFALGS
ncbi:MAG TPA: hypothetical protein VJP04_03125 [Terriglobales bacterium]|nr:hypothetical protein [Terriglobales bacterium]